MLFLVPCQNTKEKQKHIFRSLLLLSSCFSLEFLFVLLMWFTLRLFRLFIKKKTSTTLSSSLLIWSCNDDKNSFGYLDCCHGCTCHLSRLSGEVYSRSPLRRYVCPSVYTHTSCFHRYEFFNLCSLLVVVVVVLCYVTFMKCWPCCCLHFTVFWSNRSVGCFLLVVLINSWRMRTLRDTTVVVVLYLPVVSICGK